MFGYKRYMKKIFLIALFIPLLGGGITFAEWTGKQQNFPVHKAVEAKTAAPVKLTIPKLGVATSVESVGMDKKGRMDVPQNADNVAWYSLGYKPGDRGNAVIAGHFDKVTGAPAVFYNIENLQTGDKIVTTDAKGKAITFSVVKITKYPYDGFPLQEVFGTSTKRRLNLITCEGQWNSKTKNYSHRTVVYAEMIEK